MSKNTVDASVRSSLGSSDERSTSPIVRGNLQRVLLAGLIGLILGLLIPSCYLFGIASIHHTELGQAFARFFDFVIRPAFWFTGAWLKPGNVSESEMATRLYTAVFSFWGVAGIVSGVLYYGVRSILGRHRA